MAAPTARAKAALGPRTFAAIVATLAEPDASVAMVYLMHVCAAATIGRRVPADIQLDVSLHRPGYGTTLVRLYPVV